MKVRKFEKYNLYGRDAHIIKIIRTFFVFFSCANRQNFIFVRRSRMYKVVAALPQQINSHILIHLQRCSDTEQGRCDHIAELIKNGAQLDALDKNNRTALHLCILRGNDTVLQQLLDAKCDVELRNGKFHRKVVRNYEKILRKFRGGTNTSTTCCEEKFE